MANDLNQIQLIGRVGGDPEMFTFDSGDKQASFTLATNYSYKKRNGDKVEGTDWHNIVISGPLAEVAEKYIRKGKQIYLSGSSRQRKYKSNGEDRYITELKVKDFQLLGSKSDSSGTSSQNRFED